MKRTEGTGILASDFQTHLAAVSEDDGRSDAQLQKTPLS